MPENLSPAAKPRSYDRESRVVRSAAKALGLRPGTVGQYVRARGIHIQVATILRHAIAAGDAQLAERLFAPILAAYRSGTVLDLNDQTIHRAQVLDAEEEVAESRYRSNPSMDNLRTWRDTLRKQCAATTDLLASIDAALEAA